MTKRQRGIVAIEAAVVGAVIIWALAGLGSAMATKFETDCVEAGGEWTVSPAACSVFPYDLGLKERLQTNGL